MNPNDSIDGLGFTFTDLKPESQMLALFRLAKRQELNDEQRDAMAAALKSAKNLSDRNQAILRGLIGPNFGGTTNAHE
jgi:hypothetical protein